MTDSPDVLPEGKLPPEQLELLLHHTARRSPRVIVGAEAGEDAAVVEGAGRLVVTTDPITFASENIGTYTVAVNCNDIVAMGGIPAYLTTTVLLPKATPRGRLSAVFREIEEACREAELLWVGGHTEVTTAVNRIVVSAQVIGFLAGEPTQSSAASPGELLVMSKWAALEATTLIAREQPEESRRILGERSHREVLRWLYEPGISILREGRSLQGVAVRAAHDPTEGGLATGVHEIAARSGVGVILYGERIPVRRETRLLCGRFGIDPLGALSSGVFLFTCEPEEARRACRLLEEAGIPAAVIGEITEARAGVVLREGERSSPLPVFAHDEILKLGA